MKYIIGGITVIFLAGFFLYINNSNLKKIPKNGIAIASDEFQSLSKDDDFTLIDIRNERELEETGVISEIDDHKNVYNELHVADLENMDKNRKYLFYCAHGNRSRFLKEHLIYLGFTHVYDLEGGEAKRSEENYPLVPWK